MQIAGTHPIAAGEIFDQRLVELLPLARLCARSASAISVDTVAFSSCAS